MKIKKFGALLVSAALCVGMAVPAFAFEGEAVPVEQPILPEVVEEDVVTVTDETSGALTPEGNLTLVDDYHTDYSDGSGQQFITLVSKSGNTFYLVIDRNAKGQQTVHFMNLVDEADLLALMEEEDADAYTAEKRSGGAGRAGAQAGRRGCEKSCGRSSGIRHGNAQGKQGHKDRIRLSGRSRADCAGGRRRLLRFRKAEAEKTGRKEALDPDANYTEDKGDFEIPMENEPEETSEENNTEV